MTLMITALHMVEDMSIPFSLWGGHLWNPSYCAVTVSDRSVYSAQSAHLSRLISPPFSDI